jgi:hypothetical protein
LGEIGAFHPIFEHYLQFFTRSARNYSTKRKNVLVRCAPVFEKVLAEKRGIVNQLLSLLVDFLEHQVYQISGIMNASGLSEEPRRSPLSSLKKRGNIWNSSFLRWI